MSELSRAAWVVFLATVSAAALMWVIRPALFPPAPVEDVSDRLRFENEMRALATANVADHPWPSSAAVAVRPVDLADSGYLYEGRMVLVLLRNWKQDGGSILWRRWESDAKPAIEFRMELDQRPDGVKVLWIEGQYVGTEDGKIVVTQCRVLNVEKEN